MSTSLHSRLSRTLAVVVSTLCLTGQLLTAAHDATERHVLCAEHGELTHLRSGVVAPTADRDQPIGQQIASAPQNANQVEAHDHCAAVVIARRPGVEPILVVAAAPSIAPPPPPAAAPLLPPQTARILLTAPKNAPPC